MSRPVTLLVVFFLSLNLFAGVLVSTGAAATLGINAEVGGDAKTEELNQTTDEAPTGSPSDGTLFGLYNVIGGFLSTIYDYVFPGLDMLERAGVPSFITDDILGNLFSLLIVIDIAAFVRGYEI